MRNCGISSWIVRRAQTSPERIAVIHEDEPWTYARLAERVIRLANGLRADGIRRGDRVAYLGPNHPAHLETLFACGLLGAVAVPLHTRFEPDTIAGVINNTGCATLIFASALAPTVADIRDKLCVRSYLANGSVPGFARSYEGLLSSASGELVDGKVELDDTCLIAHTSGTTGDIKGVVITHRNMMFNVLNILSCIDYVSSDVLLTPAPLYRMGALGSVMPLFFKGATVVLASPRPSEILEAIERHRATVLFSVPRHFEAVMHAEEFAAADLSSLRFCLCGGDVVREPVIRTYLDRGLTFQQGYGLTEATLLALSLDAEDVLERMGSVGRPPLFADVRVARADLTEAAPGEIGEIVIRGPNVTTGYWERPDLDQTRFTDGWLRTGDGARRDDDGFVYLVGRVADALVIAGETVYPRPIERVLETHPSVLAAAVIAATEGDREMAVTVAVPRSGHVLDGQALWDHCAQHLPAAHVPRVVYTIDSLPRNVSGKVMRRDLRALVDSLDAGSRPFELLGPARTVIVADSIDQRRTPMTTAQMTPAEIKKLERVRWDRAAAAWERHDQWLEANFDRVTKAMFAAVQMGEGDRVLDCPSGTGQPSLAAAQAVGPEGQVLSFDLSDNMVAVATKKAAARGLTNIEYRQGDAEQLEVPAGSFDRVTCREGLNLMPNPEAFLSRANHALRSGGRIVIALFGSPHLNPPFVIPVSVVMRYLGRPMPPRKGGLFTFADNLLLQNTVEGAGFTGVKVEPLRVDHAFDNGRELLDRVLDMAPPVSEFFDQIGDPQRRKEAEEEVLDEYEAYRDGDKIVMPGHQWLASGEKP